MRLSKRWCQPRTSNFCSSTNFSIFPLSSPHLPMAIYPFWSFFFFFLLSSFGHAAVPLPWELRLRIVKEIEGQTDRLNFLIAFNMMLVTEPVGDLESQRHRDWEKKADMHCLAHLIWQRVLSIESPKESSSLSLSTWDISVALSFDYENASFLSNPSQISLIQRVFRWGSSVQPDALTFSCPLSPKILFKSGFPWSRFQRIRKLQIDHLNLFTRQQWSFFFNKLFLGSGGLKVLFISSPVIFSFLDILADFIRFNSASLVSLKISSVASPFRRYFAAIDEDKARYLLETIRALPNLKHLSMGILDL